VEESLASLDLDAIKLKSFPGRGYIPLGSEENLYRQEDFYFYPTVVFYKGAEKRFGAMLTPDTPKGDLVPREIPEGEYLVGYHRGPYETISDSFRLVMERSKALGLRLDEEIIDINIIDQFVERDSRKYVTEIQCRLISG
jgi:effector-binding domain-containing protein